jgi:hypothetical protein
LTHTLIEDVEHRPFLVDANLVSWLEGYVAYQDTKANGHEQHGLEVMLDGKVNEKQTHTEHYQALGRQRNVVKTREVPELLQVLS